MQSKMVFKICEGILYSSFSVEEFDVIVHKKYFPYNPIKFLAILFPKSLTNLVVEVGTSHSHQILLGPWHLFQWNLNQNKPIWI